MVLYDHITKESISNALKTVLHDTRWVASLLVSKVVISKNYFCFPHSKHFVNNEFFGCTNTRNPQYPLLIGSSNIWVGCLFGLMYSLFNDAFRWKFIQSRIKVWEMNDKFQRNWKWSWLDFKVLLQYLSGQTEENRDKLSHDTLHPSRDLNREPPEYKTEVLITQPISLPVFIPLCLHLVIMLLNIK
jgi:hypothetical protein